MEIRPLQWKSHGHSLAYSLALGFVAILVPVTMVAFASSPTAAESKGGRAATASLAVSTTGGVGPYAGLAPAFDGTFSGTSLDTSQWQTCYPWEDSASGCTNFGNSQEQEWYLPSQDQVSGGVLHLVSDATPTPGTAKTGAPKTYPYRSGMVTTYSSFDFTYGYVQVTARIPGGTGTWPALWLLPQSQAWPPEIDIMENWGTPSTIRTTLHWGSSSDPQQAGQQVTSSRNLTAGWNTYGVLWQPGSITWYLDGQPVYSYTGSAVPDQPMYFLANLAIDGPASPVSSFDIQSVKIYDSSSLPISTPAGTTARSAPELAGTGGPEAVATPNSPSSSPPPSKSVGYDLVGADGGVFVFHPSGISGGFYGSLPGIGVSVDDIVGIAPTTDDHGYFLVGRDGGVFSFGNAPYLGSLPGIGVSVDDIVGIAPTTDDQGYFLVGRDGGVFSFGNAPYLGSLPGIGISVDDIVGIAATTNDQGYWEVASDGAVYSFGDARYFGRAGGSSAVSGIAGTPGGGGYWVVTKNGSVYSYGDAAFFGSLPSLGVSPAHAIVGLVPSTSGYWLVGSDGGLFAFGKAPYMDSLPGEGVSVDDIVGATPTSL